MNPSIRIGLRMGGREGVCGETPFMECPRDRSPSSHSNYQAKASIASRQRSRVRGVASGAPHQGRCVNGAVSMTPRQWHRIHDAASLAPGQWRCVKRDCQNGALQSRSQGLFLAPGGARQPQHQGRAMAMGGNGEHAGMNGIDEAMGEAE